MKFLPVVLYVSSFMNASPQTLRTRTTKLMGACFDISIVAKDSLTAEQNIDSCINEIRRIEYLISD